MKGQESLLFNYILSVKICVAISKPWQVKLEINNKIGVMVFAKFLPTLCCLTQCNIKTAEQIFICSIPP